MRNLIFHGNSKLTLGAELELQLIDPHNQKLIARAKELLDTISNSHFSKQIKPEVTQGMIEINSSVHSTPQNLHDELYNITCYLEKQAQKLDVDICGGGTHPFQLWRVNKIFPSERFKNLSWHYRYLSKRITVFALHMHIAVKDGNDALYLTHILSRYLPHFIALSASSPFYQGIDTGFNSSRVNVVDAFPSSGHIPFEKTWEEFSAFYFKMKKLKLIHTMKDFYWDIRPKPTFGTVEIRVCDTPLTIARAVSIVAYAQTLARYLLKEKPFPIVEDIYLLHSYNRFLACRYGFEGNIIDPHTFKKHSVAEDILMTLKFLKPHADALKTTKYLNEIASLARREVNDAAVLRKAFYSTHKIENVVRKQCELWKKQF
jgi:carboxylate-amine ligase